MEFIRIYHYFNALMIGFWRLFDLY